MSSSSTVTLLLITLHKERIRVYRHDRVLAVRVKENVESTTVSAESMAIDGTGVQNGLGSKL
eukprot:3431641-Rhodomonas_salina.1